MRESNLVAGCKYDAYDAYDGLLYFFAHIARERKEIGRRVISVISVMDLDAEGRREAESASAPLAGLSAPKIPRNSHVLAATDLLRWSALNLHGISVCQ